MEQIAFILGEHYLYWSSIILTLASAAVICLFLSVYLGSSKNATAGFFTVPLSMVLSLAAARLLHWYCYEESYASLLAAMTDFSSGGFALLGVIAGCVIAAVLTRLFQIHKNLPQMLDCMSLAGAAGIALGRLASFFNASDRGQLIQSVRTMPWVYPVTNSVSGVTEYRLATFLLQAMVTGLIFLILLLFFASRKTRQRHGDITLVFALLYGASEVILDSTRYDSMYFRSNGFVSIVQVCGAVAIVLTVLLFSVRLVRNRGFRGWYLILWTLIAGLFGCAGYMEYYVQRHGNEAAFAYSVMGACLVLLVSLTLLIRGLAAKAIPRPRKGRYQRV